MAFVNGIMKNKVTSIFYIYFIHIHLYLKLKTLFYAFKAHKAADSIIA